MDPSGPGGSPSSKTSYDACARYGKAVRYTVSGVMNVSLGTNGYSFQLSDLAAEAAQTWNAQLRSNACSFTISPAGLLTPNFVINSDCSNKASDAVARATPQGYEKITGLPVGICVNKAVPISLSLAAARKVKTMFDSSMSSEDIAHALALVTLVHEFGHTLGLAHPIEEPGNTRDAIAPEYSPYSMQWLPQTAFDRGPLMIGAADIMLDVMWKTPNKRPLKFADMRPSDVEANVVKQLLSCSVAHLGPDAQRDATCASFMAQGRKVLQYPDLVLPIYELINE